ncbi:transmembrane protein, putative (macronuclear) [Tetrahymena thermophila SB210]|uniref:Transmembrane protein, putative n=1 Tax=Tetrahymena thermophila (strain SB210) TaxID=312017 RepID=Q23PS5_TETTS|nr:transmembrane protein, putative [Tetrahymena thermophila SB210]EAR98610.1 transmembrane protein, putative [Tetrahymena thermophila SB210]|eukprot:XP_001018855.1 transmembrane protein, putative [Tetrahymena thermophila SB210]
MYYQIGIFFLLLIKIKSVCDQQLSNDDLNIGLIQCENCGIVQDIKYCSQPCLISTDIFYFSQKYQCVKYCGNGKIAFNDCNNTNQCIDGYQWNIPDQKCIQFQTCAQKMVDQNLQLYQCQSCYLVSDVQYCSQICKSTQYFSNQKKLCYDYCTDGKIASYFGVCQDSQLCIDGYQLNSQKKCEKFICQTKIPTSDSFSAYFYQCPDCSITIQNNCLNPCLPGSEIYIFYSKQSLCMIYCGNGIIAISKQGCLSSTLCMDGTQWSDSEQKCKIQQGICPITDNYVQLCPNCSLVTNLIYCYKGCQGQQYYDYKSQKCMFYCSQGVIAQDQASCQSSNLCIDGFTSSGQGKCDPIKKDENNNQGGQANPNNNQGGQVNPNNNQDGQVNSNNNQSTSKYEQNSLIVNIMISLIAVLIIIILVASFFVLKKFKTFQKVHETINDLKSTLKIYIDKINNQQLEIDQLRINRNTNNQLQNNQFEIYLNQNGEDQALQGENDSQKTLKQLENDIILQQQYSKQNYQENPLLQEQVNQQNTQFKYDSETGVFA